MYIRFLTICKIIWPSWKHYPANFLFGLLHAPAGQGFRINSSFKLSLFPFTALLMYSLSRSGQRCRASTRSSSSLSPWTSPSWRSLSTPWGTFLCSLVLKQSFSVDHSVCLFSSIYILYYSLGLRNGTANFFL